MPEKNTPKAPEGATLTRVYTLTVEVTCTATVEVESTSALAAGKWLRDVAIPNQLLSYGPMRHDWTTAKATWDDTEADPVAIEVLADLLSLVMQPGPTVEAIATLTSDERRDVEAWAAREHLAASDNPCPRLPMPAVLVRAMRSMEAGS